MHNKYYSNEDLEEAIPLSNISQVKIRVKNKNKSEVEKCIEKEYRTSILVYAPKESTKGWKTYIGIFAAFAAGFFISVNILLVRLLKDRNYHLLTIASWRYLGSILLALIMFGYYILKKRKNLFHNICSLTTCGKDKWMINIMLALNGSISCISVILRYYSLKYLTLADSTVVCYSSPVVVVILAHLFLKEKCGIVSILVSLITVIGVGIIARPPLITGQEEFDIQILIGVALATGSMFGASFISIIIRKIRQVHFSITVFVHGLYGSVISTVAAVCLDVILLPQTKYDWILSAGLVITAFLIQIMLTLAFKFEEAARVQLILCLEIILSFVWQYFFLDTRPDIYSLVGSVIIISSVLITISRKWLEGLSEENKIRKWCCCLLK